MVRPRAATALFLGGVLTIVASCSSGTASPTATTVGPTTSAAGAAGVPDGYPTDVDVVAPLVITTVGSDPIPVTGTDGKVHVVYELEILNLAPRPAIVTSIDTLAGRADGPVVASIDADEVRARSVLLGDFGLTPAFTEIPVGRAAVVLLDDVYASRADVPDRSIHRITATLGDAPVPALQQVGSRYPDTVTQVGGVVAASHETPVVLGPPLRGDGWVAANGCCANSSHRGAMMPVGGRLNAAERFAIDFLRVDTAAAPSTYEGDGTANEDYLAYGEALLAVADGTVVSVLSDVPDSTPQQSPTDLTFEQLGGSYVILDIGGGNFVYYAHMVPGSATVKVGDKVTRGQVIGDLGNSGQTSEAHVHIHVSRAGVPLTADNVPYVFDSFTFVGTFGDDGAITPGPDTGPRTDQLPLVNAVVNFPAG